MSRRALAIALLAAACSSSAAAPPAEVRMRFDRADFFAAPFPSEDLRAADGRVSLAGFPNPDVVDLVARAVSLLEKDARGFATSAGVFFSLTGALDPARLPTRAESMTDRASVFLVGVDETAPDFQRRYPIDVSFAADGGPFGAPNLLSLVPLQGIPLRPKTTYAAVVTRRTGAAASREMASLAAGTRPAAMPQPAFDAYARALAALGKSGVAIADIAGVAVFTTDAPMAQLETVRADALARPLLKPTRAFQRTDVFDGYCAYASTIAMPVYQEGAPPYDKTGGAWTFDAAGKPLFQRTEEASFVVTIPRAPMPPAGYPLVVLIRTGAGGDRPLVDRGPEAVHGGPPLVPGTGPALHFARAGFAGASVDGPHGGLRNVTHGDEQFIMFNIFNGPALRDNVRQSALELIVLAHVLESVTIDATDCAGASAGPVKFDLGHLALMGHSMGATIAPLVLALEPRYGAGVLSGAGGSWIENVMWKKKPLEVRPPIELFLGYARARRALTAADPVLSLLQWAEEPADPQVYARRIVREPASGEQPRHMLMEQGIVDHYILPRIANALSLALGLDLGGEALDEAAIAKGGELAEQTPLASVLGYSGRAKIALPASGNFGGKTTALVIQHAEDGIEDGHEVVFQTDPPKHEYRCFLAGFATGTPVVPAGAKTDAPCK